MGGCASKPKDFNQDLQPAEGSTSSEPTIKDAQGEIAAQETGNVDQSQKEEPLVDLSDSNDTNPDAPKADREVPESKAAIEDLVSEIGQPSSNVNHEAAKQTEDNVGAEATEKTKDGPEEVELQKPQLTSH